MCCQLAEPSASSNRVSQLLSCSTKPAVHPRRSLFTPLRVPFLFFLARLSTDPVPGCSSRALPHAPGRGNPLSPCSEKIASTRFGTRPPLGAVTLPLHTLRPATASRSATGPSRRSRRSPAATNTNWLCSTLLLFRCAGLQLRGHKKPRRPSGTSGRRYGTSYVPVRRCLGSSMLPLSRLVDGSHGC